jgi:exosortase A-associated hydrolase 2
MRSRSEAFFHQLPDSAPDGQRYVVWHQPAIAPSALVVYVHPFAEEMNKARRMAALQSRALADAGVAVLQFDLHGCGDSGGDFGDATWQSWVADVRVACNLVRQLHAREWPGAPSPPLWLWGLRAGSLLACAAAQGMAEPVNFVFWQPSTSGKTVLQQFLRLKVAATLGQADSKGVLDQVKQDLAAQRHVDIAGYRLPPAVAKGLEQAMLEPHGMPGRVLWLETSTREEPSLLPASVPAVARWRSAGWQVQEQAIAGPAFWSTVEIEDAPNLLTATTQLVLTAGAR